MSGFIHTLNIGDFLAPVIQGILIHVIAYMIIEILKNRKQKDKKDGCSRPFLFDPRLGYSHFVHHDYILSCHKIQEFYKCYHKNVKK